MRLLDWNILCICCWYFIASSNESENRKFWVHQIIHQIFREIEPLRQATIFVFNTNRQHYIEEEFSKQIAILQINPSDIKIFNNSSVNQPTVTSLFVVVLAENQTLNATRQFEIFLENLTAGEDGHPIPPRPKCLVIFFGNNSRISKDGEKIENILRHGWSKKFLDLTVVTLFEDRNKNVSITITYYNPYFSFSTKQHGINNKLFPDKLKNMNGYKYRISIDPRRYRKTLVKKPIYGLEKEIVTNNDEIIFYNCRKKLNFTVKWIDQRKNKLKFNMLFAESTVEKKHPLLSGRVLRINYIGIAVPDVESEVLKFHSHFVVATFLFIIILGLGVYSVTARTLKLPLPTWRELNILLCMLGARSIRVIQKWREKILYLIVVGFYLVLAMDAIFMITELRLEKKINVIDSFDGLRRFHVPNYTSLYASYAKDEETKSVKHAIRYGTSRLQCIKNLHKMNDRICAMGIEYLRLQSAIMKKELGRGLRIIDLTWSFKFKAFLFEIASPYVKKYNDLLLCLFEAGIVKIANANQVIAFFNIDIVESNEIEIDGSILFCLYDLLVLGLGCSMVVFIVEVVYEFLKSMNGRMLVRYYCRLLLKKIQPFVYYLRLFRFRIGKSRKVRPRI